MNIEYGECMNETHESPTRPSIVLPAALLLVLVLLKLTGVVTWHWGWILAPVWVPIVGAIWLVGIGVLVSFVLGKHGGDDEQ